MRRLEDLAEAERVALLEQMGRSIELAAFVAQVERPQFAIFLFGDDLALYLSNCDRAAIFAAVREALDELGGPGSGGPGIEDRP